ncbi:uncharacterized protein LOC122570369 isoform X1 [Bombus pyrosoma]|uniref:uncharacterized protein LOC122570369 isoform X1 n=1 Tax=Bombus pyrosoma TaxID=396416 RepID=UPI001CB8B6FA|nr:uncharacterized protein LOC122570369 isoform X1 [Bombus pyrosoma]
MAVSKNDMIRVMKFFNILESTVERLQMQPKEVKILSNATITKKTTEKYSTKCMKTLINVFDKFLSRRFYCINVYICRHNLISKHRYNDGYTVPCPDLRQIDVNDPLLIDLT